VSASGKGVCVGRSVVAAIATMSNKTEILSKMHASPENGDLKTQSVAHSAIAKNQSVKRNTVNASTQESHAPTGVNATDAPTNPITKIPDNCFQNH
jgi:hypothetical protein